MMKIKNTLKTTFTITLFVTVSLIANSQYTWYKTFGGSEQESGLSVKQTADGGFICAGHTHSFNVEGFDIYLIKTDAAGNVEWEKTYGGPNSQYINYVINTSDGGFLMIGRTSIFLVPSDIYILKVDAAGEFLWDKKIGGEYKDEGRWCTETQEGDYIFAGLRCPDESSGYGAVIKTDSEGNILWEKEYEGSDNSSIYCIENSSDNGFIFTGFTFSNESDFTDGWLAKIDSDGELLWEETFREAEDNSYLLVALKENPEGDIVACGKTDFYEMEENNAWLLKTDPDGEKIWSKTFGGDFNDGPEALDMTNDGGIILAGFYNFGVNESKNADGWIVKTDGSGEVEWTKFYGGQLVDGFESVQQTEDNGFILAGYSKKSDEDWDILVVKTNSSGELSEEPEESVISAKKEISTNDAEVILNNYPNPFSERTMVSYSIPGPCHVTLSVYNSLGARIATLVKEFQNTGNHEVYYDCSDLASGIYYCILKLGDEEVKKAILIRE
jgi:hypothetical protein